MGVFFNKGIPHRLSGEMSLVVSAECGCVFPFGNSIQEVFFPAVQWIKLPQFSSAPVWMHFQTMRLEPDTFRNRRHEKCLLRSSAFQLSVGAFSNQEISSRQESIAALLVCVHCVFFSSAADQPSTIFCQGSNQGPCGDT